MKLFKKTCALMLSFVMVFLSTSESLHALADAVKNTNTTTIQNEFIKVTVDNATGRYGVRTVEGQPIRKKDQETSLLFKGDDPETSFTTFRIDGTDYIYGNKYKFGNNFYSETTAPKIVVNTNGTQQLEMIWKIKGVEIKQILMLYTDSADKVNSGNVNIRYEVNNKSGAKVQVGSRILLDTMVGSNDGPLFQIGTAYQAPLMVERKLTHDPKAAGIPDEDAALYKLPSYWVMRDKLDLANPQATNVVAYGFNNIAEQNINIVDEMIVGHWNGLANTKWDYTVHPNLDFTRDTNDYGSSDSAVAFYWNPDTIAAGGSQSFETVYGLGEIIAPDKVFSIRYVDQIQQLATLPDNSAYNNEGIFDITAEVENLAAFGMEHSQIEVQLDLESGLDFVKLDSKGDVVRDKNGKPVLENTRSRSLEFKKSATPEEAEQGIKPKYKPGDTIAVSFKVMAKGRPWPVTREYMLTARSPETQSKIEGVSDKSIKAQYESNKSNFILLPPVGEATPTYVYGISPKELYSSDVKYMTVNLSNIEAYNTGNETTAPNFDLYLKETVTGERYKVDVQDAIVMQPTDDGMSGDMRITYRGGAKVDESGKVIEPDLGPELPLGEYQVEIDYKGDAGGDEEVAAMYDITTEQTILVSDNDESRIREAGIMVVYKQLVDVSGIANGASVSGDLLDDLNSMFPDEPFEDGAFLYNAVTEYKKTKAVFGMASKAVDPEFELSDFMDDEALEETPLYNYKLFDSEEELEAFEAEAEEEEIDREVVVVIRGMIKQVGSKADEQVIVDTKTEPAIINDSVAYTGKDLAFVRGKLDIFGVSQPDDMPFLDTLFIKGDGTLSVASSGFIFHQGEWTLDFFNGFNKSLGGDNYNLPSASTGDDEDEDEEGEEAKENTNPEDDTENGSLKWAVGGVGDRLNPLRQVMIEDVYFNKQSLFGAPSFSIDGFGLSFNDFILREGGISFGGSLSMKIVNAEINNVVFNDKGFVGIDAALKFDLGEELGLFGPKKEGVAKKKEDGPKSPSGEITVTHYVQDVGGEPVENQYGLAFDAQLKNMLEVSIELSLKKVKDGRILPDVIAFGAGLPSPGILITGATYLTGIRGAVRELADTIAGGSKDDPFPLTVSAGVSVRFGMAPAYFFGDVDLTVKRTGLKVEGKLDYSAKADAEDDDKLPMLTEALLEAQWVTPWFVRVQSEMDIGGWDIIIGKAGIFVGQNLEKNRTDFEGYIGSKIQIPNDVPIVGGMPLSSMFLGVNNDKVWGSIGILLISLGVTYYWGGGVEFGTSTDQLPDGMIHLVVDDPELGPRLMVIGQGVETLATSEAAAPAAEQENQEIVYHDVAEGVEYIENGSMNISVGGITVKNSGRVHEIPMDNVTGNAVIEMEYESKDLPAFSLKDASGKVFPVKFDNTNTDPTANAFTQYIPASKSPDQVDVRKAYIIVPADKVKSGGKWTLTAVSPVKTKLLNVPTVPQLNDINLAKDSTNANKFTASWKVANAGEGDTVNLYLAEDAVTKNVTKLDNGQSVLEAGDPGLLIAKDIPVGQGGSVSGGITSGSTSIDVTNVTLMGNPEDIRGLLRQGNYYLRAELNSSANFATKTSAQKFEITDPFAPQNVSEVKVEPAGNGLFALSFKPGAKKAGHADYEHSYVIDAKREQDGAMKDYSNFGEILFTEDELAPYWNASTGKYEGILIGGWSATSTSDKVELGSLEGTVIDLKDVKYVGLEVGHEYEIGVSAATIPTAADDKNQNYHYADRVAGAKKLLPVPVKPKLNVTGQGKAVNTGDYINLLTKQTEQTLTLTSDQKNVTVEAFYADQSIGKVALSNTASGSQGTLKLDQFKTDGPFAIELRATNSVSKDLSVTMLYLTVDTIAPVLYIDQPATGARTVNDGTGNTITVAGTTTKDTLLKVGSTVIPVADDGTFNAKVAVNSAEPTVALQFTATDAAGNENSAVVDISNESFEVPSALILEKVPSLQPGQTGTIKAYLKVADGKDENGKTKYKQVAVKDSELSKITYSVASGDSVEVVTANDTLTKKPVTTITALSTGSSLIEGEYTVAEGVTLQGYAVASVAVPKPEKLGSLTISAETVYADTDHTKIVVSDSGDMTGQQLAYKIYPAGTAAVLPVFESNLSDWKMLPADGVISVKPGDVIVVAKRTSLHKLAMAAAKVSSIIHSNLPGGTGGTGGGGGGGGAVGGVVPVTPAGLPAATLNGQPVDAAWDGTTAIIHVTADSKAGESSGDITISSTDSAATGFNITVDLNVAEQAIAAKKKIIVSLPQGQLVIGPENLAGLKEPLKISIGNNSAADKDAMTALAKTQNFTVLGAGGGTTVAVNLPAGKWTPALQSKVMIPSGITSGELTAVVLKDDSGNWTTVPWKLAANGSYVDVQLTGEGSLFFINNTKAFKDVAKGFWAEQSIQDASDKLFVMGKAADSFVPQAKVTRAELPTILLRVAGLMNNPFTQQNFTDVAAGSWYSRSVSIAAELGIVTGQSSGQYAPQATLTRMEAMTMVGRLLNVVSAGGETLSNAEITQILSSYADKDMIPAWAKQSIALSIKYGILRGTDGKINPAGVLTRAEAAAIAIRLDEYITDKQ
ncbi:S-layer homology domain-containing protein [Paenibacillus auburnensis]|uniref:S-layer homology domain-containing protein n=1 Tax=Paenibacillus auburnensis TaxID=2905649 RepID=UPI001F1A6647|nr:S-layer homology domain-containing protein [Paenibacillus auburnensis]